MEAVIVVHHPFGVREPDDRIDDRMANLMADDIEIQTEGAVFAVIEMITADLHEAITHGGIVEARHDEEFHAIVPIAEMPVDWLVEVALPNVEDETGGTIEMRHLELRRADLQMIEVALFIGKSRRMGGAPPGGRELFAARADARAIGDELVVGVDRVHPLIGRPRSDCAGRRRYLDSLGLTRIFQERWLREQEESRSFFGSLVHLAPTPELPSQTNVISPQNWTFV